MSYRRNIIFDTDIAGDCDDVIALCLLCAAHKRGECTLSAVTSSMPSKGAMMCTLCIIGEYGLCGIPAYNMTDPEKDYYPKHHEDDIYGIKTSDKFYENYADKAQLVRENPVKALRRLLAESNEKFTLAVTGPLYNIGRLLDSEADEISPLDGVSLVREKVELLAVMGGNFENTLKNYPEIFAEWNIKCDIKAAKTTVDKCPVKTVFLPFEAGYDMITGAENVKKYGEDRPSSYSFICHGSKNGRHSWDPATILYAVCGEYCCFEESPAGKISIDDNGITSFSECENGLHHFLRLKKSKEEIASIIDKLIENDR